MCGICGFVAPAASLSDPDVARRRVAAMADRLRHRGPDDAGAWAARAGAGEAAAWTVALAHRRLAVIDPGPTGRQPMTTPDGAVTVVYNGEVYNFRELRRELIARGAAFRTRTDTEVILHGWRQWGEDLFGRLNGMFALAVWDAARGVLVLARDRVGIKPLYVARTPGGGVAFASEVGAVALAPGVDAVVDRRSVARFLELSWIPAPGSILRGVERLAPGTWLRWHDGRAGGQAWWRLEEAVAHARRPVQAGATRPTPRSAAPGARADAVDEAPADRSAGDGAVDPPSVARLSEADDRTVLDAFDALILDAVDRRLVADVPLGAFLSGGTDSSLVVSAMVRLGAPRVDTFCVGFDEAGWDESPWARAVAEELGTRHHELRVTPAQALAEAAALARRFDEPQGDPSALPAWLVSRFARESGVTVALSGDGGDELFGGYPRYRLTERLARLVAMPEPLRTAMRLVLRATPWGRLRRAERLARGSRSLSDLYAARLRSWKTGDAASLVLGLDDGPAAASPGGGDGACAAVPAGDGAPEPWRGADDARALYGALFARLAHLPPGDALGRADVATYLVDDVLAKVDRTSMAVGLEVRVPLLDHRLVTAAFALPPAQRRRWARGKRLLRELLARELPRRLVERPKQGFGVPVESWLRGPLRGELERALDPDRLRADGLLDVDRTRALLDDFFAGRARCPRLMWSLLILQSWLESAGIVHAGRRAPAPGGTPCIDTACAC